MERIGALILWLLFALPCAAQYTIPQHTGAIAASGGGITWSVIQNPSNLLCSVAASSTAACSLTATITAGDALIACSVIYTPTTSAPTASSMSGDGSWTHAPSAYGEVIYSLVYAAEDCYYLPSATGGTSETFTFTWTTPSPSGTSYPELALIEVKRSTGTASYDTSNNAQGGTTNPPGANLTLTGTSDYIFHVIVSSVDITAASGAYTNPFFNDATGNQDYAAYAGAVNRSSGSGPTYTSSGSAVFSDGAIALK